MIETVVFLKKRLALALNTELINATISTVNDFGVVYDEWAIEVKTY